MKGSRTTPRDSSKLRVEVLLEALLIQHKCGHTNNIKHVYNMNNVITIQDIKMLELRDSGSNINTEICFEVRATTLRPRLLIGSKKCIFITTFTIIFPYLFL